MRQSNVCAFRARAMFDSKARTLVLSILHYRESPDLYVYIMRR
jgi:hypothetical protein